MFDDNISSVYGGMGDFGKLLGVGHTAETFVNNAARDAQTGITVDVQNYANKLALAQLKLDLQGGNEHPASSWISTIGGAIGDNIDFGPGTDVFQGADLIGKTGAQDFMANDFLSGLSPVVDVPGAQGIGGAAGRFAGQLFN